MLTVHKSVKFKAFRKIPVLAYQNDVKVVLNNQRKTPDNINNLIDYYNSTLQNLTNMLHYNVRTSHCDPIRPGT